MPKADYDRLHLTGDWLCDVELLPAPDSPGTIDSPWGATNIGYIASGDFSGPRLNGRVLPGGGDWPALSIDGQNSYQVNVRAVWQTEDNALINVRDWVSISWITFSYLLQTTIRLTLSNW